MYEFIEKKSKLGRRLYFVVLAVFLVFAVSFIIFQQAREKQFKISTLTLKLSNYNALLEEDLSLAHDKGIILSDSSGKAVDVARDKLNVFIREHESKDLRITLIRPNGKVVYDKPVISGNSARKSKRSCGRTPLPHACAACCVAMSRPKLQ